MRSVEFHCCRADIDCAYIIFDNGTVAIQFYINIKCMSVCDSPQNCYSIEYGIKQEIRPLEIPEVYIRNEL